MEILLIILVSGILPVARGMYCSSGGKMDWIMAVMAAVPWPAYLLKRKRFVSVLSGKYQPVSPALEG